MSTLCTRKKKKKNPRWEQKRTEGYVIVSSVRVALSKHATHYMHDQVFLIKPDTPYLSPGYLCGFECCESVGSTQKAEQCKDNGE